MGVAVQFRLPRLLDNWSVPNIVGVDMLRRIYSSDNAKHTSIYFITNTSSEYLKTMKETREKVKWH